MLDQGNPVEWLPPNIITKTESRFHDSRIRSRQSSSTGAESESAVSLAQQVSNDSPADGMSSQIALLLVAPASRDVSVVSSPRVPAIRSSQSSSTTAVREYPAIPSDPLLLSGTLVGRQSTQYTTLVIQGNLPVGNLLERKSTALGKRRQPLCLNHFVFKSPPLARGSDERVKMNDVFIAS